MPSAAVVFRVQQPDRKGVAALVNCNTLTSLYLNYPLHLTLESLSMICSSCNMTSLSINCCPALTYSTLGMIAKMPKLEKLTLKHMYHLQQKPNWLESLADLLNKTCTITDLKVFVPKSQQSDSLKYLQQNVHRPSGSKVLTTKAKSLPSEVFYTDNGVPFRSQTLAGFKNFTYLNSLMFLNFLGVSKQCRSIGTTSSVFS